MNVPGSELTAARIADWVELLLLFTDESSISGAAISDQLAEDGTVSAMAVYDDTADEDLGLEYGDALREEREAQAEGQSAVELLADDAMLEIEYRATLIGDSYPISVSRSVAKLNVTSWRESPIYSFLVALNARFLWSLDANLHRGARLFERLVVPALAGYWGGRALHFGWPRDQSENATFRAALPRLATRMRERLSIDPAELSHAHKDLAVDAVAWRQLDDRRGNSVLLCQCAIGGDWDEKGVKIEEWRRIVNFAVAPIAGLAFPFIPNVIRELSDLEWLLLCARGGVPFDRLRLAHLIDPVDVGDELLSAIKEWTEELEPALVTAAS